MAFSFRDPLPEENTTVFAIENCPDSGIMSEPPRKGNGSLVKLEYTFSGWVITSFGRLTCFLPAIEPGKGIKAVRITSKQDPEQPKSFVVAEATDIAKDIPPCPACEPGRMDDCRSWHHWFHMNKPARDLLMNSRGDIFKNGFPDFIPYGMKYWEDLALAQQEKNSAKQFGQDVPKTPVATPTTNTNADAKKLLLTYATLGHYYLDGLPNVPEIKPVEKPALSSLPEREVVGVAVSPRPIRPSSKKRRPQRFKGLRAR
jgi:hypothetical protein